GSVSAEDQAHGESVEAVITSPHSAGSVACPVPISSSSGAGATSNIITASASSGAHGIGGATPASQGPGSGTPSTPVNLPAVLQDRPHSGRGRVPPPVPPRSPRGGTTQPASSSSFSLVRGGVAYLTMPPSPRFAGGSPRFSHLCSPSIGMAGYNIWHAESMRRLNQECMMPMLHVHPCERQHYVWQLPAEDVIALSPMHSGSPTPDNTPQKRAASRTSAEAAIHAVREVFDVIKTASKPSTPSGTPFHHPSQSQGANVKSTSPRLTQFHSCRPFCLSAQMSVDQGRGEFLLPDTHITYDSISSNSSLLSHEGSHSSRKDFQKLTSDVDGQSRQGSAQVSGHFTQHPKIKNSPYEAHSLKLPNRGGHVVNESVEGSVSRTRQISDKQVSSLSSHNLSGKTDICRGVQVPWNISPDLSHCHECDTSYGFSVGDLKTYSRKSYAGAETLRPDNLFAKRKSMADRPSEGDQLFIEQTLSRYLARSESQSYKDKSRSSYMASQRSPSSYSGSPLGSAFSPSCTLSPYGRSEATKLGARSVQELNMRCHAKEVGLQSLSFTKSSPSLLENSVKHYTKWQDDNNSSPSPDMQKTFYLEV
ncbi:hypothetical protein SK128_027418, partial [Halocaridina rubra]